MSFSTYLNNIAYVMCVFIENFDQIINELLGSCTKRTSAQLSIYIDTSLVVALIHRSIDTPVTLILSHRIVAYGRRRASRRYF